MDGEREEEREGRWQVERGYMGKQVRGGGGADLYLLSKPLLFAYCVFKYYQDAKVYKDTASSSRGYLVKHKLFFSHTRTFVPLKS